MAKKLFRESDAAENKETIEIFTCFIALKIMIDQKLNQKSIFMAKMDFYIKDVRKK